MTVNTQVIGIAFKKYPVLLAAVILCVPLALICYFRGDAIVEQQAELEKYQAENSLFRANIANASQLQQQVDFLTQAKESIGKRAFRSESLPLNLQYFYKLEAEVGVKYIDLRPSGRPPVVNAKSDPNFSYVPLNYTVGVQGSFTQVITYLHRLEQGAYFCRINSASAIGSGSNVTLTLDLDLLGIQ
jgi:hypothetical protein